MSRNTLFKLWTTCAVLAVVSTTTFGCKTTQQHSSSTELASTEEPALAQGDSQNRPVSIMYAVSDDEMTCIYAIVSQVLKANFKDPLSIDNHYGWRPGLLDARKYWFTVRSGNGTSYTLHMRATHSSGRCYVDVESINPLYMQNSEGETVMSIQGSYSNSLFKALNQGFGAMAYAMFWVAIEVKDALRPAPRAPSGRVGDGM